MSEFDSFSPLVWNGEVLRLIDQLLLPGSESWVACTDPDDVATAIRSMQVRGAPAIGIAAAYGVVLAAKKASTRAFDYESFIEGLEPVFDQLAQTRPTAVNLFWALGQMRETLQGHSDRDEAIAALETRAIEIHEDDIAMCRRIGKFGAELFEDDSTILTHCNTGALATGGYGTALGVIRAVREAGKKLRVLADETRPYLQGSRLTAWELHREGFDVTLLPDSAAPFVIAQGKVSGIIVGADRIAENGDTANKIGTYSLALAAKAHNVPFYIAAPMSTIDFETASGKDIPIEERSGKEMFEIGETAIAPEGVGGLYPAFDVTPAELITAIVTDQGVAKAPYEESLAALRQSAKNTKKTAPKRKAKKTQTQEPADKKPAAKKPAAKKSSARKTSSAKPKKSASSKAKKPAKGTPSPSE